MADGKAKRSIEANDLKIMNTQVFLFKSQAKPGKTLSF